MYYTYNESICINVIMSCICDIAPLEKGQFFYFRQLLEPKPTLLSTASPLILPWIYPEHSTPFPTCARTTELCLVSRDAWRCFFPWKMSMKRKRNDKHGQLIEFWKLRFEKNVITIFGPQYLSPKWLSLHHKGPSKVSFKSLFHASPGDFNAWSFLQRRLPSTWRSKHAKWQKVQSESSSFMQVKLISSAAHFGTFLLRRKN